MDQAGGFVSWLGTALGTLKTGPAMEAALASTFTVAGIASLVLAAFCLTLPHTPPAQDGGSAFAPVRGVQAAGRAQHPRPLHRHVPRFAGALLLFLLDEPLPPDIGLPENWIAPAMSIGQIAEIATMASLGLVLKRLGWRMTMIIGHPWPRRSIRDLLDRHEDLLWLVILSNVVHGFAYAFFFATVYIYVDENFPKDVARAPRACSTC